MKQEEKFKTELAKDAAFPAKIAYDFHLLIVKQAESVYQSKGITFPVAASSTTLYLSKVEEASLAEISRALAHPHQLVAQRVKVLLKLGLIVGQKDTGDKRRTIYRLTKAGKIQAALLEAYCSEAAVVFKDLSVEVGVDLQAVIHRACVALEGEPLAERFRRHKKESTKS